MSATLESLVPRMIPLIMKVSFHFLMPSIAKLLNTKVGRTSPVVAARLEKNPPWR